MRHSRSILPLFSVFLLLSSPMACAVETILSESSQEVLLSLADFVVECEGSYEDDYEHLGWWEDIYRVTFRTLVPKGVRLEGHFSREQSVDCPAAVAQLEREASARGGKLTRQLKVQLVKTTYEAWFDRRNYCVTDFERRYGIDLFPGVPNQQSEFSGHERLVELGHTELGDCPRSPLTAPLRR